MLFCPPAGFVGFFEGSADSCDNIAVQSLKDLMAGVMWYVANSKKEAATRLDTAFGKDVVEKLTMTSEALKTVWTGNGD